MYACLQLNSCQIFCATYSLLLMSILNSFFCCIWERLIKSLILFLKFSIVFSEYTLYINMYNAFPSLSPFYATSILFLCWIRHVVLIIMIDWILICNVFSLALILASSKVVRFHNEAQTFFYQKIGTNLLILPLEILYKSSIFSWYSDSISLILSGAKRSSLFNSRNSLRYSRSTSRSAPSKLLLAYFFKTNYSGSIHLNPLAGRKLDIA